VNTK